MTIHSLPARDNTKEESLLSEPSATNTHPPTQSNYLTGQLPVFELPLHLPPRLVTVAFASTSEILKDYFGGEQPSTPPQDTSDPRVFSRTNSSAVSSTHSLHTSDSVDVSSSQPESVMTSVIHSQSRDQIRKEVIQNYDFLIALIDAKKGSSEAQFNLGKMYEQGQGVKQDYTQAADWYRKAAEQGHAVAQFNLGSIYGFGFGVKQDDAQELFWYRKAAEQGDADAQFQMGKMYAEGKGVEANDVEAFNWYLKAANNHFTGAQLKLASHYQQGLGVKKDVLQATYWWLRSVVQEQNREILLHGREFEDDFYSDVIQCIPAALTTFPEFKYIKTINFQNIKLSEQNFLFICQLICANSHLEGLNLECQNINDVQAMILLKCLAFNTTLTELIFDYKYDLYIAIFDEIKASLAQNVVIAELREHMRNHPITRSNELPREVLSIIVDNMIVAASKGGIDREGNRINPTSKEATIAAIDEFLKEVSQ